MKKLFTIIVLSMGLNSVARADVWTWLDADGNTHFVNTNRPIYTWIDDAGINRSSGRQSVTAVKAKCVT